MDNLPFDALGHYNRAREANRVSKAISIAEAARRLGISKRMVWKLVEEGNFVTAHEAGRGRRTTVDEAKVREYADALEAMALMDKPTMHTYGGATPKPDPDGRHFMRAVEAAVLLGVTRQRLEQVIAHNELAAFRIGRCVLLRPADVVGYKAWKDGEKPPLTMPLPPLPGEPPQRSDEEA